MWKGLGDAGRNQCHSGGAGTIRGIKFAGRVLRLFAPLILELRAAASKGSCGRRVQNEEKNAILTGVNTAR